MGCQIRFFQKQSVLSQSSDKFRQQPLRKQFQIKQQFKKVKQTLRLVLGGLKNEKDN